MAPGFERLALCTGAVLLLHVAALLSLQPARLAHPTPQATPGLTAVQSRWIAVEAPSAPTPAPLAPAAAPMQADVLLPPPAPPLGAEPAPRAGSAHAAGEADYLPRPMLSLAPVAMTAIPIDYPAIEGDAGHYRAVLALFIDETGRVRRVRAEGPALPAPLEDAARTAFMNARFTPGEVDGAAVRALIRVEVGFDHRAAP